MQRGKRGFAHKNAVLTLVERGGSARSFHIDGQMISDIMPIVRENIAREATIMTHAGNPFFRGVWWRRSNVPYRCDICDALQEGTSERAPGGEYGGFYPRGVEPTPAASHPNCRCVILPDYEDPEVVTQRLGDWLEDPTSQPELEEYFNG